MLNANSLAITAALIAGVGLWNSAAAADLSGGVYVDPAEHGGGLYDGGLYTGQSLPYQMSFSGQTGTFTKGGASVTLSDDPTPAVTATATVSAGLDEEVGAIGFLAYYFTITGPADGSYKGVVIPLLIHSKSDVVSSSPDTVTRAVTGYRIENGYFQAYGGAYEDVGNQAHYDKDIQFFTFAGVQSRIAIQALVQITNEGGAASASAYIDPTIMIDPIFALTDANYLNDFTLSLSDGMGNGLSGGVPEPATWGLMLLGFGAMGLALRRRRAGLALA